jgi:hypothetical protein
VDLHNLYSSPGIIRITTSRKTRWEGHVAGIEKRGTHIGYWWASEKERNHQQDQDVGGWIMLK